MLSLRLLNPKYLTILAQSKILFRIDLINLTLTYSKPNEDKIK